MELDTNPPNGATRAWNDISGDLRHFKIEYGRQFELDRHETGTQEYTLDNVSGNYRMANTGGAYYPNLKPHRRVRFYVHWKDVDYFLGYGRIESITPTREGNYSEVVMKCVDSMNVLAQRAMIPSVATMTTSLGVANGDLTFTSGGTAGAGGGGVFLLGGGGWKTKQIGLIAPPGGGSGITIAYDASIANFPPPPIVTVNGLAITVQLHTTSTTPDSLALNIMAAINGHAVAGRLVTASLAPGNNGQGKPPAMSATPLIGTYVQELSGARVNRILDSIGWPAGDRSVGTGIATMQPAQFLAADNVKAIGAGQDVAASELGQLFADGQGRIVFQARNARTTAPFNVSSVTFSDYPAGGEYGYSALVPVEDTAHIYNNIAVSRNNGGTVTVTDATSIADFDQIDYAYATILSSNGQLTTLANLLLPKYKVAKLRYDSVTLEPFKSDGLWDWLVSLGISNQVTIKETPPGSSALSTPCFIEKITHEGDLLADPVKWTTTYGLSPV